MENMTSHSNDIDEMVLKLSNVLRSGLVDIIENIKNDSSTFDILNQLPIVKDLNKKNLELYTKIVELNSEIAVLKNDLNSIKPSKPHLKLNVTEMDTSDAIQDIKQITIIDNPFLVSHVNNTDKVSDDEEKDDEEDDEEEDDEEDDEEEDDEEDDEEEDDGEEDDEEEDGEEEEEKKLITEAIAEHDKEEEDEEEVDEEEEEEEDEEENEENDGDDELTAEEARDLDQQIESEEGDESEEEDDNLEVEEWSYKNKNYYVTGTKDGIIFECLENEEIGEEVGNIKNGKVFFS
jgi:hypothetical protein